MAKKRKQTGVLSFERAVEELLRARGFDPKEWKVSFAFTKGILTGNRGVVASMTNLRTKRVTKKSGVTNTKNRARALRLEVLQRLLDELA